MKHSIIVKNSKCNHPLSKTLAPHITVSNNAIQNEQMTKKRVS